MSYAAAHIDLYAIQGSSYPDDPEQQRFARLIAAATQEITERYPDYFRYFGIEVRSIAALAKSCQSLPAFRQFAAADLELALMRGLQVLDDLQIPVTVPGAEPDEISRVLLQSILDAYAAVHGAIPLNQPPVDLPEPRYAIQESPSGARYLLSKGEGRPLLIISTTGAPIRLWSTLLDDPDMRRPRLTLESRAGSFIEGGTPHESSLSQDVADMQEVLRTNDLDQVDIVAWCNGSRPAIALAREAPGRVASLMLISPTFHGSMQEAGRKLISEFTEPAQTGPGRLPPERDKRVDAVLRLRPHSRAQDLVIPLSSVAYFRNYIGRVLSDETYDVRAALPEVHCPILLVTGTHDAAINTRLARDLLATHGRDVVQATLSGAGHDIHLLQYAYFKYLLDTVAAGTAPVSTARLSVERLAPVP
jgi:pimeloyl-ACP methyl ester carboxylesterase